MTGQSWRAPVIVVRVRPSGPEQALEAARAAFVFALLTGTLVLTPGGSVQAQASDDRPRRLDLSGDLRLRYESDWDCRTADGMRRDDRERLRIRARVGLTIDPVSWGSFGLRLRTGASDSHQSPHVTLADFSGNPTGPNGLGWDRWFVSFRSDRGTAWVGRNSFPFWTQNELFWDEDVTPMGLSLRYDHPIGAGTLTVSAGYFALPDGMTRFVPHLSAGQLVYSTDLGAVTLTAAGGAFFFDGRSGAKYLRNGNGARDYAIWAGSVESRMNLGGLPVAAGADVMRNLKGYSADDPDPFTAANRDQTDGYVARITVGGLTGRGGWLAAYYYAYVEPFAVNASYAQDDWHRFGSATQTDASDFKGHEFRLAYALGGQVNLVARLYLVEAITTAQEGKRFRVDFNWRLWHNSLHFL